MQKRLIQGLSGLAILGSIAVLFISIGGYFPQYGWWLNWYSHPRPHFFVASLIATGWFVWQRQWWLSALPIIAVIINGAVLTPFFIPTSLWANHGADRLTIAHLNTNQGKADMSMLNEVSADIIFLQEFTPQMEEEIDVSFPEYELVISHPLTTTIGVGMLLHHDSPFETDLHRVNHMPWYNYRPLVTARLELDGERVQIMSIHASRPHHDHADAFQKLEMDAAAGWGREQQAYGYEVIMIGDINMTPWSLRYKEFLEMSQTEDSMLGYGIQNSWTAVVPMWMGLPVDHAAISDGLQVIDRQTIPVEGSDHGILVLTVGRRVDSVTYLKGQTAKQSSMQLSR
ncbi:MAG: endonuclease/exonuclease/phosphatase family protein [Chloroflexota bacterium]